MGLRLVTSEAKRCSGVTSAALAVVLAELEVMNRWLRREARDFADIDFSRRVPRVVGGLHAQPHVGAIPERRARNVSMSMEHLVS